MPRMKPTPNTASALLGLPRRLCYTLGSVALAGALGCSAAPVPADRGRQDMAAADSPLDDAPAPDPGPADQIEPRDDGSRSDRPAVVFTFECQPKDINADLGTPCPEGKQVTDVFPPECPEGCEAVGLG
jgi:hypothetical protein